MADGVEGLLEVAGAAAAEGIALAGANRGVCSNCGEKFHGPYCAHCGQERDTHRRSVFGLVHDLIEDVLSFDSRMLRTALALLAEPGELPKAFREGRVRRYVPPVRLYFFVTLLFFLTLSVTGIAIIKLQISERKLTADQQAMVEGAAHEAAGAIAKAKPGSAAAGIDTLSLGSDSAGIGTPDMDFRKSAPTLQVHFFVPLGGPPPALSPHLQKGLDEIQANLSKAQRELSAKGKSGSWLMWLVTHVQSAMLALAHNPASVNGPLMDWIPRALFLLMPAFALLTALFYIRQRRDYYFVDHLVFSLNVHTFVFVVLTVLALLAPLFDSGALGWVALAAVVLYSFLAMKRFYHQGWALTAVKFAGVMGIYFFFFLLPALIIVLFVSVLEA